MKRILFVNGNLAVGGVERALVSLLKGLRDEDYDIDLLLLQPGNNYLNEIPYYINVIQKDITNAYGPIIETFTKALKRYDTFTIALRICLLLGYPFLRFLRRAFGIKKHYDIAISFRPGICEDIVLNMVSANKKYTWWHHGDFNIGIPREKIVGNWIKFDKIITVSKSIATKICDLDPRLVNKVTIIPNIIDKQNIIKKAGKVSPYQNTESFRIITVSRLSKEKNLSLIIPCAKELKCKDFNFEWNIIGNGDIRGELEALIHKENLTKEIVIRGQKDNPYPWIKYADLMMHPSNIESFGIVLLESMALETPCISVPSLGAIDLINGKNGLLVKSNPEEIAIHIQHLKDNLNLRTEVIENGISTIDKFSPSKVINKFNALLK